PGRSLGHAVGHVPRIRGRNLCVGVAQSISRQATAKAVTANHRGTEARRTTTTNVVSSVSLCLCGFQLLLSVRADATVASKAAVWTWPCRLTCTQIRYRPG